jgi:hypothetical protein
VNDSLPLDADWHSLLEHAPQRNAIPANT